MANSTREIPPDGELTAETVAQPESWDGIPAAPDRGDLPTGTRVGRLTITGKLGAGGMGVVYAALDSELDRNVALKFMRPKSRTFDEQEHARERMLREARAMAQISHPHVITVFDVGTFEDDVYVAMEMVQGQTLADWLEHEPRTWDQVLAVYIKAGRGLAAAHAADLIHRDFKPDNVLVDDEGRVKVTDFGLVGYGPSVGADTQDTANEQGSADTDKRVALSLTATDTIMGTPRYMAPEQYDAAPTSAATDQFNFCVALYESLYGVNPFAGKTLPERYRSILSGHKQPADAKHVVPAWIVPILERGLAVVPSERHPSMAALLRLLSRNPAARRRRMLGASALIAVAAVVGALSYRATVHTGDSKANVICKGAERRLVGVWDDQIKAKNAKAFGVAGVKFANATWTSVSRKLDIYAAQWAKAHTAACEATHRYKEQSPSMLDLRMSCLDERRTELATLTDLFSTADKTTVQQALAAVHSLSSLARCSDVRMLRTRGADPGKNNRAAVVEVRSLIAKAKAFAGAGKHADATRIASSAMAKARTLGYRSLQAEAGHRLGLAQDQLGERAVAIKTLQRSLWNAEASGHDHMILLIWVARLHLAAKDAKRSPVVETFVERASATLARHKNKPPYMARMQGALGALRLKQGRFQQAYEHFNRALIVWTKLAKDTSNPTVPHALNNVALAEVELGKYVAAERHYREALRRYENRVGRDHPRVAEVLGNLGLLLMATGRTSDATNIYRRQLAISVAHNGEKSRAAAVAHNNLGGAYTHAGDLSRGLSELQQALHVREALYGANHPDVASTLHGVAVVLRRARKLDHALAANLRAVAIMRKTFGHIDGDAAHMVTGLAETRMLRKEFDKASKLLRAMLPIEVKARGNTSPEVRRIHMLLAICTEELQRFDVSIHHYQAALAITVSSAQGMREAARLRMMLSRALYRRGKADDKKRARVHAQQALTYFTGIGDARHTKAIKHWMRAHK